MAFFLMDLVWVGLGKDFINIMIIFQIKEEPQHEILTHKSKSLHIPRRRIRNLPFQNSKLAFAFQRNYSHNHNEDQFSPKKVTIYKKRNKSDDNKQGKTVAINCNLNFQLINLIPCSNADSRTQFLKKKSLSILKTPEQLNTYRSLSTTKRSQTLQCEVKMSRTQILKSMLIQYDKTIEQKTYLKRKRRQTKKEKSLFLTDLGQIYLKDKQLSKSVGNPKLNNLGQQQELPVARYQEKQNKVSINQEQIEIIVRNSLREIQKERQLKKNPTKSLISFTQKSTYMKKMKRVKDELEHF